MGRTDIKAGIKVDEVDKGGGCEANIETGKKASVKAITNTDHSANSGGKVTNQHIDLVGLAFTILAIVNYADNPNLAVSKKTPSGAATFISDKFLAIFAALTNKTLEKIKLCEFNLFLFAVNYQ